tara:strand:+ start:542 stop:1015 length:474 start_codon:yes stop_codon:yes gene_type:complete
VAFLRHNPFVDEGYVDGHWGHAASGILYAYDDKVLLLKRSVTLDQGDMWSIPGGAIPVDSITGEPMTAYESALKEAREELGSLPPGGDRFPVEEHVQRDPNSNFTYTTFTVVLPQRAYTDWTPILDWEHTEWGWYTASEALRFLDLHPGIADLLSRS